MWKRKGSSRRKDLFGLKERKKGGKVSKCEKSIHERRMTFKTIKTLAALLKLISHQH